jgi:hypothetical protein
MAYWLGFTHSVLALQKFRNVAARDCFRESAALWRRCGDRPMLAQALVMQAGHEYDLPREAVNAIADEGMRTARTGGDSWTRAFCLAFGTSAYGRAPPPEAEANLQEAIGGARATGDPWLYAEALECMAMLERRRDEYATAAGLCQEALAVSRSIDNRSMIIGMLRLLADCNVGMKDARKARELARQGVGYCMDWGARGALGMLLGTMAGIAMIEGKTAKGVRLITTWATIVKAPEATNNFRTWSGLDPRAYDAEAAIGRVMTLEQAVAYGTSEE